MQTVTSNEQRAKSFTSTLIWNTYLLELIPKLNRAVGLLSKIRHYTPKSLLRTIYYSLFNLPPFDICLSDLGTVKNRIFNKIQKLQDKAVRVINFLPNTAPVSEIYKTSKILNLCGLHLIAKCFTSEKLF